MRGLPGRALVAGLAAVGLAASTWAADAPQVGLNVWIPRDRRSLAWSEAVGVGHVRVIFQWSSLEPLRGAYDRRAVIPVLDDARRRGLEVVALLQDTPRWVSLAEGVGLFYGMTARYAFTGHQAAWARFVAETAAWTERRFPGVVRAWEIWNEPHIGAFWSGSAGAYRRRLLEPAARALREAVPRAKILALGGYGYPIEGEGGRWDGGGDVREVLEGLRPDLIDGVSLHSYYEDRDPVTSVGVYLRAMRTWLVGLGFGGHEVWLTETGASTALVLPDEQAVGVRSMLDGVLWSGENVLEGGSAYRLDRVTFYALHDATDGGDATTNARSARHGMMLDPDRPDGCGWLPKPAMGELARVLQERFVGLDGVLTWRGAARIEAGRLRGPVALTNRGRRTWRGLASGDPMVVALALRDLGCAGTCRPSGAPGERASALAALMLARDVAPGAHLDVEVDLPWPAGLDPTPRHVLQLALRPNVALPEACATQGARLFEIFFGSTNPVLAGLSP